MPHSVRRATSTHEHMSSCACFGRHRSLQSHVVGRWGGPPKFPTRSWRISTVRRRGRGRTQRRRRTGTCFGNDTLTYTSCSCARRQLTLHAFIAERTWLAARIQGELRLVREPHVVGIKLKRLKVFERAASAQPSIVRQHRSIHCHTAALLTL